VIALLGGLGNQLFQVAFARWLQDQTGRAVRYDVSFKRRSAPDVLELSGIGAEVGARVLAATRLLPTPDGGLAGIGRTLRRLRGPRRIVSDYRSPGPTSPAVGEAAWWFGYWQRLEYAAGLAGPVREALDLGDRLDPDGAVGVHVRRGDMLVTGTSLPESWFGAALRRLPPELRDGRVIVYSDDPEWCRTELDLGLPFEVAAGATPVEHLRGLGACRALVISRSTFSWWAAAVAGSRGASVAFPAPWWPDRPELEPAIVPSGWIPVPHAPQPRAAA
jgi:hypothetical protein